MVFLAAFQIRYSIATLEAGNTFLFIPFHVKPCTNTIGSVGHWTEDVLHRGDELIAVNDRPFSGMSVYQSFFGASWSAWLLLFAVYCFRGDATFTAWWAVSPIFAVAGLKTFVAIGSSEYLRAVAPIHNALESASTEITVILFFSAALVTWNFGRMWALASLIVAAGAATVLCWPASVPKFDPTWMYDNDVYYRTPELLGACFTAAVLLVILVAGRRTLVAGAKAKWRLGGEVLASLSMVLLLGPFLYSALSRVVVLWFMRFVPQGVLISLYAGLLGAAWLVFSTCRVRYSRNAVLLPFGMGVQLQRNPQDGRHG